MEGKVRRKRTRRRPAKQWKEVTKSWLGDEYNGQWSKGAGDLNWLCKPHCYELQKRNQKPGRRFEQFA